jgi:hypothetical protein
MKTPNSVSSEPGAGQSTAANLQIALTQYGQLRCNVSRAELVISMQATNNQGSKDRLFVESALMLQLLKFCRGDKQL